MKAGKLREADRLLVILHGCRTLPVSPRYTTLIDEEDLAVAGVRRWQSTVQDDRVYAVIITQVDGKRSHTFLHRLLAQPPRHLYVDHRNRDTLDNRKANLRHATNSQNQANSKARNKHNYKGIWIDPRNKHFKASVTANGIKFYLGTFDTAEAAARAYDAEAVRHFGEFARTNFPIEI